MRAPPATDAALRAMTVEEWSSLPEAWFPGCAVPARGAVPVPPDLVVSPVPGRDGLALDLDTLSAEVDELEAA